jgi:hypothetical protein
MLVHEATCSEDVRQHAIEAFKKTVTSELEARVHAKQKFMEHVKHITAAELLTPSGDTPSLERAAKTSRTS